MAASLCGAAISRATVPASFGRRLFRRSSSVIRRAVAFTFTGAMVVIAIGVLFSLVIPGGVNLLNDSQIASRTSPGLVDLISAVATGFAGSVAFARRDASIESVTVVSTTVCVDLQTPGSLPPTDELLADLGGQIPNGIGGRQDDRRAANKRRCGGAVHRYPLPTGVALDAPADARAATASPMRFVHTRWSSPGNASIRGSGWGELG